MIKGGGERTYITPEGAKRLQDEMLRLRTRERPKIVAEVQTAAAHGDRSENAEYIYGKKKLREIDRRLEFLIKRFDRIEVVPLRTDGSKKIFFGASLTLEDESGERSVVRIVGEDEIDLERGDISWRSPIGRAVLGKIEGDDVRIPTPSGFRECSIVEVSYVRRDP